MPINGSEAFILLILALLLLGPERLPRYARQAGRLIRELRRMASDTQEKVRSELDDEWRDVDLSGLDPRQYHPRRLMQDSLGSAIAAAGETGPATTRTGGTEPRQRALGPGEPAPFDDEAT